MISTLINLLGSFYESKDFSQAETIAHTIHAAIPGDQVSLKFLGLVYYRTGRINEAIRVFDLVESRQNCTLGAKPEKQETNTSPVDSAVVACAREATLRLPYLAQAWRELGNALLKSRKVQRAPQSFQSPIFAQPAFA